MAVKRKIRNRLQDMGECIFVQSDGREDDEYRNLRDRAAGDEQLAAELRNGKKADTDRFTKIACEKWIDVRTFGQVFAFKKDVKKSTDGEDESGSQLSVGIRGPVSIQQAVSVDPIEIIDMQITRSVNAQGGIRGRASDTMGMKHYVNFGLYVIRGSINCQLAEKLCFSDEDAGKVKKALCTLFENDASSARPDGTCEVCRVYWWKHGEKTPKETSAMIQRSLKITPKVERPRTFTDYDISVTKTTCVPEVIFLL